MLTAEQTLQHRHLTGAAASLPPGQGAVMGLPTLAHARVSRPYASTAWQTAVHAGVPVDMLTRVVGTDLTSPVHAMHGTSAMSGVSVTQYLDLLARCAKHLNDPAFGLRVGMGMGLSTYAGYGLVLCTCPDFGEVARATQRYEALAHDLGRSHIEVNAAQAVYRWTSPWLDHPAGRHLAESVMAGILAFVRWLAGEIPAPLQLDFVHEAPAPHEDASIKLVRQAAWGDAIVRYGQAHTQATFPASWLNRPLRHHDPTHAALLAHQAEQGLQLRSRRDSGQVSAAVYELICARLGAEAVDLVSVAKLTDMGPRRLQRKLAQEGVAYSELVQRARQTKACRLLLDTGLTLTEVAFSLGFNQSSSFNHAFRAWFGVTPAQWRAAQVGPASSGL